jgi:polar amino acid transport system substrate-binding protein
MRDHPGCMGRHHPSLTGGQIDAIMASMSITEERKKVIDFSDKYYNTPTVVVAAKGSGITPTPEGLAGKIIGVQVSTIHEAYAKAHFPDAELKTYQTTDEGFQDLAAGRVDASQADSIAIDAFMATDAGKACCEVVGAVADDPAILGAGVGVGLRQGRNRAERQVQRRPSRRSAKTAPMTRSRRNTSPRPSMAAEAIRC